MRVGIYNQTITYKAGGTESYTAFLVQIIQTLYPDAEITIIVEKRKGVRQSPEEAVHFMNDAFGTHIQLKNIRLHQLATSLGMSFFLMAFYMESAKYDLFFNCSVNMFVPHGKNNISITHFPDNLYQNTRFARRSPLRMRIAKRIDSRIKEAYRTYLCNSRFTAYWLKQKWTIADSQIEVIYPPVKLIGDRGEAKEDVILVCSRIAPEKKILFLIDAYKKLHAPRYRLLIVGSYVPETDGGYYRKLLAQAEGQNIEFFLNTSRSELESLFLKAKIFWHAKGVNVDEKKDPYMLEHFGITTVEAMSAGCIPVVIDKGGQKEIVDEGVNGFKWLSEEALIAKTRLLMADEELQNKMRIEARKKAEVYSVDAFDSKFRTVIESIPPPPVKLSSDFYAVAYAPLARGAA